MVEYNPGHAALAHTRTLVFLRKWIGGPIFDIEAIWEEHTYFEFEVRSVAKTMGTMVVSVIPRTAACHLFLHMAIAGRAICESRPNGELFACDSWDSITKCSYNYLDDRGYRSREPHCVLSRSFHLRVSSPSQA